MSGLCLCGDVSVCGVDVFEGFRQSASVLKYRGFGFRWCQVFVLVLSGFCLSVVRCSYLRCQGFVSVLSGFCRSIVRCPYLRCQGFCVSGVRLFWS